MNPFRPPKARSRADPDAARLYGAIVARTRLPVFYQDLAVPDTLQGRFLVLSLHLFAVLNRLKQEGSDGARLAQALADRFNADMETVLRELGVGDLSIPKRMRALAASSSSLLEAYAAALPAGDAALAAVMANAFADEGEMMEAATLPLSHYLRRMVQALKAQDLAALAAGEVRFPEPMSGQEL